MNETAVHELVRDYYGSELTSSADLRTSACCDPESVPESLKPLLAKVHPQVTERFYGCGLVAPELLYGRRVLDLGCGAGRDVYLLSQLVGEHGHVIGVDMTEEQLAVACAHEEYHREAFGYQRSNVTLLHGYIERLEELAIEPGSIDVIVSNCVINLSPDKAAVLRGAQRLLAPGGEMYFADVFSDRRVPAAVREDPVLYGECLGGAQYWRDFLDTAAAAGFGDARLVRDRPITITDPLLNKRTGSIGFHSATWRLFNLEALESQCEDYGQAVIYRGTIPDAPDACVLDSHHTMEAGKVFPVCGNTWRMLADTRYAPHFDFIGDFSRHFGVFAGCGTTMPFASTGTGVSAGACC